MELRNFKQDVLRFSESDGGLIAELALADFIGVQIATTGERRTIWARPASEIEARGKPHKIQTITFTAENEDDCLRFQAIVDRLKSGG